MIYPSARSALLAAAGALPAFLIALLFPGMWYFGLIWIAGLLALMIADALIGPGPGAVAAEVEAPRGVGVGAALSLTIRAALPGGRVPIEARLGHDALLADPVGDADRLRIAPGDRAVTHGLKAARRGMSVLGPLWLRWQGPFGLMWKQAKRDVDAEVAILPDIGTVREDAMNLIRRDISIGERIEPRIGQGREFESLTEYQPGMERRMVDWKRSARHSKLLAKEYRAETNNSIVLAIDSGRLMSEPVDGLPRIDRAISAAMLTAFVGLKAGDSMRLFAFDAKPTLSSGAVRGLAGFQQLQQLAARIDYSTNETNFTLGLTTLNAGLDRRSLVILFTDFVDPASADLMLRTVGQLTQRHVVLFLLMRDTELENLADAAPDTPMNIARAVTAGTLIRERKVVIERLRLLGAQVLEADHDELGPALVERYLDIMRRNAL